MATKSKPWASATGLPTLHAVSAAVHVAKVIGSFRARVVDTRESYWRRAMGGSFGPADLRIGEALLIHCGMIEQQGEDLIVKRDLESLIASGTPEFAAILSAAALDPRDLTLGHSPEFLDELALLIPDDERRNEVLRGVERLFDDARLKLIGSIGEEVVVLKARGDLISLGHPELAEKVRQVSLYNDTAGYDIVAPCLDLSQRLLEVKSTTKDSDPLIVYLSRNEADTGLSRPNWWLVACLVDDVENRHGEVIGWISGISLADHFPSDAVHGAWESTRLSIPRSWFVAGLPSAVS